ncbi:hypothetical protein GCM10022207_61060 [Streptomyces lannensis]|uniref:Uncharacterized protein n=1 Tax=Streptomyces lannensis TaxID=766498 RepID=A0ABP7KT54_9ACTN
MRFAQPGRRLPGRRPEFTALAEQVRAALQRKPRKEPDLARLTGACCARAVPLRTNPNAPDLS